MLHITSLYASLLALLIIYLAFKVVAFRHKKSVGIGDNGDKHGMLQIRTHANALENVPIIIILMALYEVNGGSSIFLHSIGVVTLIARILHAFGLSNSAGKSFGRFYGTALTWMVTITLAIINLIKYFI